MKEIGGYFELELPRGEEYHKTAIRLNTGRNAFEYVLRARDYKKVYLPYYTCDVMLEPVKKLLLAYELYHIDETFRPVFDYDRVNKQEVFVYNNYFGICDTQVSEVAAKCRNLIIDNAQGFFSMPLKGIDTFYSPRKFFGFPDGAYLYTDKNLNIVFEKDVSYSRVEHLLGRIDLGAEKFFHIFKENDNELIGQPIKLMSNLTIRLLSSIDYDLAGHKRRMNFIYLHKHLKGTNQLKFDIKETEIPMVYPYLVNNGYKLKKELIENKVFVATYWPNAKDLLEGQDSWELYIKDNLIALPVDQRYGIEDLLLIIDSLNE